MRYIFLIVALVLLSACGDVLEETRYGYAGSPDGFEVVQDFLRGRGQLEYVRSVGTHLEEADVLVVFERYDELESWEFWTWLEEWLENGDGSRRALILARGQSTLPPLLLRWALDCDRIAMQSTDPVESETYLTVATKLREMAKEYKELRFQKHEFAYMGEYELAPLSKVQQPTKLIGREEFIWAEQVPTLMNIGQTWTARHHYDDEGNQINWSEKEDRNVLLSTNKGALIIRQEFSGGQLIRVADSSFLLDASLVDDQARSLFYALWNSLAVDDYFVADKSSGPVLGNGEFMEDEDIELVQKSEEKVKRPPRIAWIRNTQVDNIEYQAQPGIATILQYPGVALFLVHFFFAALAWLAAHRFHLGRLRDEEAVRAPGFADHIRAVGKMLRQTQQEFPMRQRLKAWHECEREEQTQQAQRTATQLLDKDKEVEKDKL